MPPLRPHSSVTYRCPFCALLAGDTSGHPTVDDLVWQTERAVAFVSPRWWPNNAGHVIVAPRAHVENLYRISSEDLHAVADLVQLAARAIKAADGCDGVSTRQHNEPAGGQDVWHLHEHVFPRFTGDDLYGAKALPGFADRAARTARRDRLREFSG